MLSSVHFFATLWAIAREGPLSMEFLRQVYWSGLLFPSSGDCPNPVTETASLESLALAGRFYITALSGKPC